LQTWPLKYIFVCSRKEYQLAHTHTQHTHARKYTISAYSGALTITCFDKHKFQFVALFWSIK